MLLGFNLYLRYNAATRFTFSISDTGLLLSSSYILIFYTNVISPPHALEFWMKKLWYGRTEVALLNKEDENDDFNHLHIGKFGFSLVLLWNV